MTTQTELAAGVAAMPRVNLMPPEIAEAERFRRLQLAMGVAVLAAFVVVGALFVHAKSGISSAQAQVDAAKAQQTTLQGQLTSLANVKATFAQVQAKQGMLQEAMGQQVLWSSVLNDLSLRIPSNVWLNGVQATENTVGVGSPSTSTPSTLPGAVSSSIGTISFSGMGLKHDDVASWLDSIAKVHSFAQPIFTSSTEVAIGTRDVVAWGGSAAITPKALSNRFSQKAGS